MSLIIPLLLGLSELDFPVIEQRLAEMTDPPPGLAEFSATIAGADALMIVTLEYKNGYPGSLKNALDCLVAGLARLRLVILAMGGLPIPETLPISDVRSVFDADCTLLKPGFDAKAQSLVADLSAGTHAG